MALSLCLAGCGDPGGAGEAFTPDDWRGVWTGRTTTSGLCDRRNSLPFQDARTQVRIAVEGSTLQWEAGCPQEFTATIHGDTALMDRDSCFVEASDGSRLSFTIQFGAFVLSRGSLQMNYQAGVSDAVRGVSCTISMSGRLTRTTP